MSNDPQPRDATPPSATPRKRRWLQRLSIVVLVLVMIPIGCVLVSKFLAPSCVIDDIEGIGRPRADLKGLEMNIIRFRVFTGHLPTTLRDLAVKPDQTTGPWRRLIEESALKDPWGNDYRYRNPGTHNPTGYDIFSVGPDGKEGTADDIGNWSN